MTYSPEQMAPDGVGANPAGASDPLYATPWGILGAADMGESPEQSVSKAK
jgi:hypothetical protein